MSEQTKVDDDGYNVGIFNNRAAPFMYNPAPGQQIYGHSVSINKIMRL